MRSWWVWVAQWLERMAQESRGFGATPQRLASDGWLKRHIRARSNNSLALETPTGKVVETCGRFVLQASPTNDGLVVLRSSPCFDYEGRSF